MHPDTADRFYDHLSSLFQAALPGDNHQTPLIQERLLRIGSCLVRIRCSSATLCQRFCRPLAHLEVSTGNGQADFTIDLVDVANSSEPMPRLPWPAQRVSQEQDTQEFQEGSYLFTLHGDVMLTALDYRENRTVGFVRDPLDWPLEHYKQAIFITLYQHLRRRGLYLIHASAIGYHGRVVLIAGSSGAGKTTTMLSCVRSRFQFLSDDTTLVQQPPGSAAQVVSLLSTINVTDQTLAWFPELAPHLSQKSNPQGKRLVMVDDVFPGCIAQEGEIELILVPEVTGQRQSAVGPASRAALLADMLPYSLDLQDAQAAREHLDFLAALLESVPSYRLLLGKDRGQLPTFLAQLLGNS